MQKRISAVAIATCLALTTSLAFGQATPATSKAVADQLYSDGRKLMGEKKYADACEKFALSQKIDPAPGTLLNLGNCYQLQGKTASAWTTFNEAAGAARAAGESEREAAANKGAASLEKELSKLRIDADPATRALKGLEVSLDGISLGPAVLGSDIPADEGAHSVRIKADGKKAFEVSITLSPHGDRKAVTIPPLEPEPEAAPAGPNAAAIPPPAAPSTAGSGDRPPPSSGWGTQKTAGVVIGGVGIAALAVGGILGGLILSEKATNDQHCSDATRTCDATGTSAGNSMRTLGPISTVGLVVGGVGLGVGAVLLITSPRSSSKGTAMKLDVGPSVTGTGAGWRFQGSW